MVRAFLTRFKLPSLHQWALRPATSYLLAALAGLGGLLSALLITNIPSHVVLRTPATIAGAHPLDHLARDAEQLAGYLALAGLEDAPRKTVKDLLARYAPGAKPTTALLAWQIEGLTLVQRAPTGACPPADTLGYDTGAAGLHCVVRKDQPHVIYRQRPLSGEALGVWVIQASATHAEDARALTLSSDGKLHPQCPETLEPTTQWCVPAFLGEPQPLLVRQVALREAPLILTEPVQAGGMRYDLTVRLPRHAPLHGELRPIMNSETP